jgi:hypothetical protein
VCNAIVAHAVSPRHSRAKLLGAANREHSSKRVVERRFMREAALDSCACPASTGAAV